jgi:hypothetical protein
VTSSVTELGTLGLIAVELLRGGRLPHDHATGRPVPRRPDERAFGPSRDQPLLGVGIEAEVRQFLKVAPHSGFARGGVDVGRLPDVDHLRELPDDGWIAGAKLPATLLHQGKQLPAKAFTHGGRFYQAFGRTSLNPSGWPTDRRAVSNRRFNMF